MVLKGHSLAILETYLLAGHDPEPAYFHSVREQHLHGEAFKQPALIDINRLIRIADFYNLRGFTY
jgi:hypothetical protein